MATHNTSFQTGVALTTTDEVTTTAARFDTPPIGDGKAYLVVARVTAVETTDHDEAAGYVRAATFRRAVGGNVTQVGATTAIATHENTAGWDCDLNGSGESIRCQVTGAVATTVNWRVDLDILEVE